MRSFSLLRSRAAALSLAVLTASGCGASGDLTMAPLNGSEAPRESEAAPPTLANGRLPDTARPARYGLSLVIDPTKPRFFGTVTIDVEVPKATSVIVMHARDLTIASAEVSVDGKPMSARASSRMATGGKEAPEELVLSFPKTLPAGKAQLRIAYSGGLDQKLSGLYRVKDGDDYYAFTQLEPMEARRMLPCFDEPGFKAPFNVKVTTPKGNIVIANASESEREDTGDGRRVTFTFATTAPLPTYLLGLAVGPFEIREGPERPVKIRLITAKGKSKLGDLALEASAAIQPLLAEYFDRPFPYSKLDLVAVPDFGLGAMENVGLITFREDLLLLDPSSASISARRAMADVVAHEIAHHWFGDLVTMKWWDDLWLKEAFATWMAAKVVDMWRPSMEARLAALSSKSAVMDSDALASARSVRQPVSSTSEAYEAFDGITYEKGGSVLGMLESWLGPAAFRDGIRSYIKAHEHGSAAAADMWSALGAASGKDILPVASSFLDQAGVPLVRADLVCEKGRDPKVVLTQSRYRIGPRPDGGRDEPKWTIPICVAYEGAPGSAPGSAPGRATAPAHACGMISGPSTDLVLLSGGAAEAGRPSADPKQPARCPKWIYPNAEEAGYFRFALPRQQLTALSGVVKKLDVRSRMGFLSNAWALVGSGDMGADDLLDLLVEMKGERHYLVLEGLIDVLSRVSGSLIDDDARPGFRAYASSILLPIAKELGWDPKKDERDDQKLMRWSVLRALARLTEDPWLSAEAEARAAAYLKDPRSVDKSIAAIALSLSSRRAGDRRFDALVAALERAPTPEDRSILLQALGSFSSPTLLRRGLDLMLTGKIRTQDGYPLILSAASWHDSRPRVLAWMKESFGEIKQRLPMYLVSRLAEVIAMTCDQAARDDAAQFFGVAMKDIEGADRPLQQAIEAAGICIGLRAREGARVKARLAGVRREGSGSPSRSRQSP